MGLMTLMAALVLFLVSSASSADTNTPGLFVFGDSLVDVGNNNVINTVFKANYLPYGVNFDEHIPTGRFTDGRVIPDYIASFIGIKFPPAYLSANGGLLYGANFASGGSGIHDSTGALMGDHAPLSQQVNNFKKAKQSLETSLGEFKATVFIEKSIFYISTGNNDFGNNFFINTELKNNFTLSDFEDELIVILKQQIKELHNENGRKFVITSAATLGCNPKSLFEFGIETPGQCASTYDNAAQGYNFKLQTMLMELQSDLPDAYIVFANLYSIMMGVVKQGASYGFTNVNLPCCPVVESIMNCWQNAPICENASTHLYWDQFHPTDGFNKYAALKFWSGDAKDISPFGIKFLSRL